MKAIGGLWWASNRPGGFLLAVIQPNRRVYIKAELKISRMTLPEAATKIADLAEAHECTLGSVYADEIFFDDEVSAKKAVKTPSIATRLRQHHLSMVPISGEHEAGWQLIRDYMRIAEDGLPWLVIDPRCKETVRTLGAVIQGRNNPDEAAGPLHMAHGLRCILSSQPVPETMPEPKAKPSFWSIAGLDAYDASQKHRGPFALIGKRVSMYG
jgi:hypothetical protein